MHAITILIATNFYHWISLFYFVFHRIFFISLHFSLNLFFVFLIRHWISSCAFFLCSSTTKLDDDIHQKKTTLTRNWLNQKQKHEWKWERNFCLCILHIFSALLSFACSIEIPTKFYKFTECCIVMCPFFELWKMSGNRLEGRLNCARHLWADFKALQSFIGLSLIGENPISVHHLLKFNQLMVVKAYDGFWNVFRFIPMQFDWLIHC